MIQPLDRPLVVRTDASVHIGAGHLMRSLALIQAWQNAGGRAILVKTADAPEMEALLQSEGIEVVHQSSQAGSSDDAIKTATLAQKVNAPWVVVDGYQFDAEYQRAIKDAGLRLFLIDDTGQADHYYADIVLNQNLHGNKSLYAKREPNTQLLLGTGYVLLRRQFLKWRGWRRQVSEAEHRVLVTLGGSDPQNNALKVIKSLQKLDLAGLEAMVLLGPTNPHLDALKAAIARSPIRLSANVRNMAEIMASVDIAISSCGTTVWELAFMGIPSIVGTISAVEDTLAGGLEKHGLFVNVGRFQDLSEDRLGDTLIELVRDTETRARMSLLAQETVDGYGCDRVMEVMGR